MDREYKWGNTRTATDTSYICHADVPGKIDEDVQKHKLSVFNKKDSECYDGD